MSLKRYSTWNLAGAGLPLLLGVATMPYLIQQMGTEAFGILTLVWALIGYFSLFDFGLGRALTQQISHCIGTGQPAGVPYLIRTGLGLMLGTGVVGGIALAIAADPLGHGWLNISENLQAETTRALWIAAAGIPLTTVTNGLRGILEAYRQFRSINILRIILGMANFGLPIVCLLLSDAPLPYIVGSLILARLVILLAHAVLVAHHADWRTHGRPAPDSRRHRRDLFSFGIWMTLSNIISPLMVSADRFIISMVLGAGMVAFYTVPFEMLIRVLILPAALTTALFPLLTDRIAAASAEARTLYRRSLRATIGIMGAVCLPLALLSYQGLKLWLGEDFASASWLVACVLSLGIFLNGIAHVPFTAIHAMGYPRVTALLHVAELVVYIPLLILALHQFGLVGAAVAWTIRVAIDLAALLHIAHRRLNVR